MRPRFFAALALGLMLAAAASGIEIPKYPGNLVNDFAGVMSPQARDGLEQKLRAYRQQTTREIVVVTVSTLQGAPVEDYAQALFDAWKIGDKDKDNGVLFLIAPVQRQSRIHPGYGLEALLPDIVCKRIQREQTTPFFKQGKVEEGIGAGADGIIAALAASREAEPQQPRRPRQDFSAAKAVGIITLVIALALALFMALAARKGEPGDPPYAAPRREPRRRARAEPSQARRRHAEPPPSFEPPAYGIPDESPPSVDLFPDSSSSPSSSEPSPDVDLGGGEAGGAGASETW